MRVLSLKRSEIICKPSCAHSLNPGSDVPGVNLALPQIGEKYDIALDSPNISCDSYQAVIVVLTNGLIVFCLSFLRELEYRYLSKVNLFAFSSSI